MEQAEETEDMVSESAWPQLSISSMGGLLDIQGECNMETYTSLA